MHTPSTHGSTGLAPPPPSNHRVVRTGFCPHWVSTYIGHWQCYNIHVSGVPGMGQGQRDHSPQRIALPSSNQWGSWAPGPDIEEFTDEVEINTKRSSTRVSHTIPKDLTLIWIVIKWVTEWKTNLYQAGCNGTISGSRGTGYSGQRCHEISR